MTTVVALLAMTGTRVTLEGGDDVPTGSATSSFGCRAPGQ
jgi:hypothetical protein